MGSRRSALLLDRLRDRIWLTHCDIRSEQAHCEQIRRSIIFRCKSALTLFYRELLGIQPRWLDGIPSESLTRINGPHPSERTLVRRCLRRDEAGILIERMASRRWRGRRCSARVRFP